MTLSKTPLPALLILLLYPLQCFSALQEVIEPGETPVLVLMDRDGKAISLDEHYGKVVIVNFWASWCTPCVREIPGLNRLGAQYGDHPFAVLGVNVAERPRRLVRFLKKHPVDFPVLYDRESKAFHAWQVRALPTSFVIDRKGRVRYRVTGAIEWDNEDMFAIIDALLEEGQHPPDDRGE